jgi:hypothetical protein
MIDRIPAWRRQAWLTEYQACQHDNNALGQQSWVSISILITVNFLVLAQVIPQIILTSYPSSGLARLIFVILLGLLMIFILIIFGRWQKRVRLLAWFNNHRMREIEEALDFTIWKNWRVHGLDLYYGKKENGTQEERQKAEKWGKLNDRLQEMITTLSQCYPKDKKTKKDENYETLYRLPTTEGKYKKLQFKFEYIFYALMLVWGIVILLEILTYCPAVYPWLLN